MTFPEPQTKPVRRLTYAEKRRAGLVAPKKRAALRKVAKRKIGIQAQYVRWIKIAMHGAARCEVCKRHVSACGQLEPHHPYGRGRENLFKVMPACSACHGQIHEHPDAAFAAGWLQGPIRGKPVDPAAPVPFTLLPQPNL